MQNVPENMSGLSTAEVEFRKKAGLSNERRRTLAPQRQWHRSYRSNVVTYYNLIFLIITILLIVVANSGSILFYL